MEAFTTEQLRTIHEILVEKNAEDEEYLKEIEVDAYKEEWIEDIAELSIITTLLWVEIERREAL